MRNTLALALLLASPLVVAEPVVLEVTGSEGGARTFRPEGGTLTGAEDDENAGQSEAGEPGPEVGDTTFEGDEDELARELEDLAELEAERREQEAAEAEAEEDGDLAGESSGEEDGSGEEEDGDGDSDGESDTDTDNGGSEED